MDFNIVIWIQWWIVKEPDRRNLRNLIFFNFLTKNRKFKSRLPTYFVIINKLLSTNLPITILVWFKFIHQDCMHLVIWKCTREFTREKSHSFAISAPNGFQDLVIMDESELSTGQMDPRVGSGRVGSGHDFAGYWRVGSGQHFGFFSFLLIISWYLNRCESSNTTFGLNEFLRYLI